MGRLLLPLFILVPAFLHSAVGQSRKVVTTQRLLWVGYASKLVFNDKWSLITELEARRYVFPDRESEVILPRVSLTRQLPNGWNATAGVAYFRQASPDNPENHIDYVRPEIRPHQELGYTHKLGAGRVALAHRYRVEERLIHRTSLAGLEDGYSFNFRIRYRIQIAVPLTRKESGRHPLVAKAYDEFMINFGSLIVNNSFDQNRLGVALTYELRKNLQIQSEFINILKQRGAGYQYFNQYVHRFVVYHTIDLHKK